MIDLKDDIQRIIDIEDLLLKGMENSPDMEEYEYHLGRYHVAIELMEIISRNE